MSTKIVIDFLERMVVQIDHNADKFLQVKLSFVSYPVGPSIGIRLFILFMFGYNICSRLSHRFSFLKLRLLLLIVKL